MCFYSLNSYYHQLATKINSSQSRSSKSGFIEYRGATELGTRQQGRDIVTMFTKLSLCILAIFCVAFLHRGLKVAVSRDFCIFFCLKDSTWSAYEQTKTVSRNFSFSWIYTNNRKVRKIRLCEVLVSAESNLFWQASPLKG